MWKSEVLNGYYSPVSLFQEGRQRRSTQLIQGLLLSIPSGEVLFVVRVDTKSQKVCSFNKRFYFSMQSILAMDDLPLH